MEQSCHALIPTTSEYQNSTRTQACKTALTSLRGRRDQEAADIADAEGRPRELPTKARPCWVTLQSRTVVLLVSDTRRLMLGPRVPDQQLELPLSGRCSRGHCILGFALLSGEDLC